MANNYFDAASQGYVNVQQQLSQLGLMGGSMQPMDGRGTAVQIPTMTAPQFTTQVASTASFPMTPQYSPPALLPFGMAGGGMTGAPQAHTTMYAPPPRPQGPPIYQSAAPGFLPYPSMPPMPAPATLGGGGGIGGFLSDRALSMGQHGPGLHGGLIRARADAHSRVSGNIADTLGKGIQYGGIAAGAVGGLGAVGALGAAGAGAGTIAALGTAAVAAPLFAAGEIALSYNRRRKATQALRQQFSNLSTGDMLDPTGLGMGVRSASGVAQGLQQAGSQMGMSSGAMMSVGEGAQQLGLLSGHTQTQGDLVSRIKTLAQVAKHITDLGEGISPGDALQLTALVNEMGTRNITDVKSIGRRLVTAARVTGQTLSGAVGQASAGAGMYSSLGMSGSAGLLTGGLSITQGQSLAANWGRMGLSPRQLQRMGGAKGMSEELLKSQAAFDKKTSVPIVYGAMRMTEEGKFEIDQDRLAKISRGEIGLKEARKRGTDFFLGKADDTKGMTKKQRYRLLQQFNRQREDLVADVNEGMSPENRQSLHIRQIMDLMHKKSGMTFLTAAERVTGSTKAARALEALAKDTQGRYEISKQRDIQYREQLAKDASPAGSRRRLGAVIGRGFSAAFRPLKKMGQGLADFVSEEEALGRDQAAGLYKGSVRNQQVLHGADRARVLGGMSTSDLLGLASGEEKLRQGREGSRFLNPQGNWTLFTGGFMASEGRGDTLLREMKGDTGFLAKIGSAFGGEKYTSGTRDTEFTKLLKSRDAWNEAQVIGEGISGASVGIGTSRQAAAGDSAISNILISARTAGLQHARKAAVLSRGGLFGGGSTEGLQSGAILAAMRKVIDDDTSLNAEQKRTAKKALQGGSRSGTNMVASVYKDLREDPKYKADVARAGQHIQEASDLVSGGTSADAKLERASSGDLMIDMDRKGILDSRYQSLDDLMGGEGAGKGFLQSLGKSGLSKGALELFLGKRGDMSSIESEAALRGDKTNKSAQEIMRSIAAFKAGKGGLDPKLIEQLKGNKDFHRLTGGQVHGAWTNTMVSGALASKSQYQAQGAQQYLESMGMYAGDPMAENLMAMTGKDDDARNRLFGKMWGVGTDATPGSQDAITSILGTGFERSRTLTPGQMGKIDTALSGVDLARTRLDADPTNTGLQDKHEKEKRRAEGVITKLIAEAVDKKKRLSATRAPGSSDTSPEGQGSQQLNNTLSDLNTFLVDNQKVLSGLVTKVQTMNAVLSGAALP